MDEWYATEAEAFINEFNLPRDEQDPIMAEVRRRGLVVDPSQRADYPEGHDQVICLRTQNRDEVAYAVSEHVRLSLIRRVIRNSRADNRLLVQMWLSTSSQNGEWSTRSPNDQSSIFRFSMGHDLKRSNPVRNDIIDTIAELLTRSTGGTGP